MDSHFEVILEKVKTLTDKSGVTVWYEIPDVCEPSKPVMILVNQLNKICMIVVDYTDKTPKLFIHKLTKTAYDTLLEHQFAQNVMESQKNKELDIAKTLRWVTGSSN